MRKNTFYLFTFAVLFIAACNQNNERTNKTRLEKVDSVTNVTCLMAIDNPDTAYLKLNYLKSGKVTGNLMIKFLEKAKNDGQLTGQFSGDTLFADYTFKIGSSNPTVYKNPLAFLRKDGGLILGVGQIETYLGKSFFAKDKPIDFRQVRFVFDEVKCK